MLQMNNKMEKKSKDCAMITGLESLFEKCSV